MSDEIIAAIQAPDWSAFRSSFEKIEPSETSVTKQEEVPEGDCDEDDDIWCTDPFQEEFASFYDPIALEGTSFGDGSSGGSAAFSRTDVKSPGADEWLNTFSRAVRPAMVPTSVYFALAA